MLCVTPQTKILRGDQLTGDLSSFQHVNQAIVITLCTDVEIVPAVLLLDSILHNNNNGRNNRRLIVIVNGNITVEYRSVFASQQIELIETRECACAYLRIEALTKVEAVEKMLILQTSSIVVDPITIDSLFDLESFNFDRNLSLPISAVAISAFLAGEFAVATPDYRTAAVCIAFLNEWFTIHGRLPYRLSELAVVGQQLDELEWSRNLIHDRVQNADKQNSVLARGTRIAVSQFSLRSTNGSAERLVLVVYHACRPWSCQNRRANCCGASEASVSRGAGPTTPYSQDVGISQSWWQQFDAMCEHGRFRCDDSWAYNRHI